MLVDSIRIIHAALAAGVNFIDTANVYNARMSETLMEQLEELLPVLEMKLSEEERQACDEIHPPGGVITILHNTAGWMKTPIL